MDDIELTKMVKNLHWIVDLEAGTVKSDIVHYRIIKGTDYIDLKSTWVSPEFPAVTSIINKIQREAVEAFKKTKEL